MPEHTHKQFDTEMEAIRSGVLTMGGLVETQLGRAISLLQDADVEGIPGQVASDEQVDEALDVLSSAVEATCAERPLAAGPSR